MTKILISDYFDTLISPEPSVINKMYHTGLAEGTNHDNVKEIIDAQNISIKNLENEIGNFFEEGNELVIVSNLGHCGIDWFIEHWISQTLNLFLKYQHQIKIFLQDPSCFFENFSSYLLENNKLYLIRDYYKFQIVQRKSDVFAFLDRKNKELYSIGDSANDVDMLLKNIELGGISSFIDYTLLERDENAIINERDIFMKYVFSKATLYLEIKGYLYYRKYNTIKDSFELSEELNIREYKENQFQLIKNAYYEGKESLESISRKTKIFNILQLYIMEYDKIPVSIESIEYIDYISNNSLFMNESFRSFKQKNLIKK